MEAVDFAISAKSSEDGSICAVQSARKITFSLKTKMKIPFDLESSFVPMTFITGIKHSGKVCVGPLIRASARPSLTIIEPK